MRNIFSIPLLYCFITALIISSCGSQEQKEETNNESVTLRLQQDEAKGTISVFRMNGTEAIVTQNAKPDFRPYLHPISAPDGKGELTQYSPGHHKHQTGLYWGFTRVNETGRDFFHHPEGDYWQRVSLSVIEDEGEEVSWQTVYNMLAEDGSAIMQETQTWTMREENGAFLLSLEWQGKALTDITIGKYDYGGLFLRMPWHKGIPGQAINAARQSNQKAEGNRAMWMNVGMQVEGRDDMANIAIFDHPDNEGFPQTWRVDPQLGVGPARSRTGDWHIKKGETETIKHQVVAYTSEFNDIELNKQWNKYIGSNSQYSISSLWGIAQEEARSAKFLSPEEAVENMTLMEGFEANAWAGEPMVTQPIAFCWDDRGRLWVAENRDYESRGYGFSNSGDSRIVILEDTDHDGTADKRTVFLEGIPFPSAIAVGFDGLYLGAPPNLLFVSDADGDDKADLNDVEVLLTGWGIRDRHETINSFHWGPDGWLYGLEGFATPSKIRKPIGEGKIYGHKEEFPEDLLEADGVDINGGVWRYHPTKKRFEVVAHGFSNPWGIDYDSKGQMFITACVIPHLFHVIPGGIYHRQGGQHFNPYVYSDIRTIVDHRHRSAHGGARIYQSDAMPEIHQGRLFMANIHEHAVLSDVLEPKGSGFVASHGDDFMHANNAQWIGFSMEVGPAGDLFVLDWHDADICGKEVLNKETGRIFRISPTNSLAEDWEGRYSDLKTMSDDQLAALQTSKSNWHARRARVILQNRARKGALSKESIERLKKLYNGKNADHRLRAMWALHITGSFTDNDLQNALKDGDEHVRAWAVQMLCEDMDASADAIKAMVDMSHKDSSPVVRLYLAAAMQRVNPDARWQLAEGLSSRVEDSEDHNIPKMIWFSLEGLVADNPAKGLALAGKSKIPLIAEFTARRTVDADALNHLVEAIGNQPAQINAMLSGMLSGLEGRSDAKVPENWEAVYAKLKASKATASLALEVAQLFGDNEATQQYIATLKDKGASVEEQKKALNSLASRQRDELLDELPALLQNPELRLEAIRAVASYNRKSLGQQLLDGFADYNTQEQGEALQTLASRTTYGRLLTKAIKEETIAKSDVPAYVARQLRRVVGNGFVEVWGPIDQLSGNKEEAYNKYRKLLTDQALGTADLANGRQLFKQNCDACHTLYGEGGSIGPDITGSNRANIEYLLSNLIEPSGVIQDDYKMVVITSVDGRTYSGNVVAESDRKITLRVIGQDKLVLNKSDIQSRETAAVSMMPEGLMQTLTDKEVLDMIAYLRSNEQVAL